MDSQIIVRQNELETAINFFRYHLEEGKISAREKAKASLMAEESLVQLFSHSPDESVVTIKSIKMLGNVTFILRAKGEEFDFFNKELTNVTLGFNTEEDYPEEDVIRSYFLNAYEDQLFYKNKKGINYIRIKAVKSRYRQLYMTLGGMFLGIIVGLVMKMSLSSSLYTSIDETIFTNGTGVFMNLLKTVVGPVVFFSIASSIAGFGDLSETGRIGIKTLVLYLLVSLVAIAIGIGLWYVFKPGNPALIAAVNSSYSLDISSAENVSVLDTILGIVPSNIVEPFLESNMLQIIFLAVVTGAVSGMIGRFSDALRFFLETCNQLFMKITTIFIKLLPLVAFCSMASMILSVGGAGFVSILYVCAIVLLGYLMMAIVYAILLLINGINPVLFYSKYFGTMIQVFAISSSNASIPLNMKACEEKLGVSRKVYSFSIPLGATINMHGLCVTTMVLALSLLKIYGVSISSGQLLSIIISIIMLSMGCPGIPCAGLVILAVIVAQLGLPVAAVSLVVGVYPFLDMFSTMVNCLGDVVTTMLVAKSEKLLDF